MKNMSQNITRYLVRFSSGSNIEMNHRFNFKERDFFVSIWENKDYSKADYPSQLLLDVVIEAKNVFDAIDKGRRAAETILGMVSSSVSCFADLCQFDRAIDFSQGIVDRIFIQNIMGEYNFSAKRELSPEIFSIFHKRLDIMRNKSSQKGVNEISRAFRWYRKGLIEQELFDQYINFWTGLESIKNLLNMKYCAGKKSVIRRCPKCGFEYEIPSSEGIKYLLKRKLGYPKNIWKELRETRIAITHGYLPLDEISPEADRLLPYLQKALLFGLLDLLELNEEEMKKFLRIPYYSTGQPVFQISCLLLKVNKEAINIENLPEFKFEQTQLSTSVDDNSVSTTQQSKGSLLNFSGETTNLTIEWIMNSDPEKPDVKMEISVEPSDK